MFTYHIKCITLILFSFELFQVVLVSILLTDDMFLFYMERYSDMFESRDHGEKKETLEKLANFV